MRNDEALRNRPLHELLNYDDDDRIVARTQFQPDHMASMSSLGSVSIHDNIKMNRRWSLLLFTTCLIVGTIIAASVCLVVFGPNLSVFQHHSTMPGDENIRGAADSSQNLNRLKDSSTSKFSSEGLIYSMLRS